MDTVLASRPATDEWHVLAACRATDPDLFFGSDGERPAERQAREAAAKRICAGCPVVAECLASAVAGRERYGIWGNSTEEERRGLRRRSERVA